MAQESTGQTIAEICRKRRVLTVVDQYTRGALATAARGSFSAHEVIDVLNRLSRSHRKPAVIHAGRVHDFLRHPWADVRTMRTSSH